jgi:hypothetical protein
MVKLLILYVFHIYNKRVNYFINNCIFYNPDIDFVVVSNGVKNVKIPDYATFFYRENIGFDFGGWSDALLTNDLYKKYDYFLFVNSSVMGPFLPKEKRNTWPLYYLNGLKYNNVKLFGSTINAVNNRTQTSHVQSYIFSMNINTLDFLIKHQIFSKTNYSKTLNDAIINKEILMSRKIIENGWNIGSLLKIYNGVNFRNVNAYINRIKFFDDVMYAKFYEKLWRPSQLIFIKGNRYGLDRITPDNMENNPFIQQRFKYYSKMLQ